MMDLENRFERFAGPAGPTAPEDVEADLQRGRRAVRRRRGVRAVAGSAFGIAAIAAAFSLAGPTPGTPDPDPAPVVAQSLRLVDYRGPQAKNFVVDRVPEGFFVQSDEAGGLTIAPASVRSRPPGIDPSKAPMYDPRDLTGKIGVYLETKEYRGELTGETVTVAGHQALLHAIGPTTQLLISLSPYVYATIQFDVPLTREQMLELGAGLHVAPAAVERAAGRD